MFTNVSSGKNVVVGRVHLRGTTLQVWKFKRSYKCKGCLEVHPMVLLEGKRLCWSAKRKSAVELLQESKAFYVKSEHVLDAKQELKHSEHLQVSGKTNLELRWKKNNNNTSTTSTSSSSTTPTTPPITTTTTTTTTITCNNSRDSSKPPIPPPRRNSVNTAGDVKKSIHEHKTSIFNSIEGQILLRNGIQQNKSPPNVPRLARPRSRTQPEGSTVAPFGGKSDFRRSHSETQRQPPDDVQMKLRRLLNHTDSKENLNLLAANDVINDVNNDVTLTNGSPVRSGDAILKPRQQQDGNYSIHKSMPDLSPTKLGIGKERCLKARSSRGNSPAPTDSDQSGSTSLMAQKSTDLKRGGSRDTSDYVSRSPSTRENGGFEENGVDESPSPDWPESEVDSSQLRRRPILRSKSDISHRFSKCGTDFLDGAKRICRSDAELERFFNSMGLEVTTLESVMDPPNSPACSSPVFFSSTSSVSSSKRGRVDSDCCSPTAHRRSLVPVCTSGGGLSCKELLLQRGHAETSIVERNARVIKWLFNCRKAKVEGTAES